MDEKDDASGDGLWSHEVDETDAPQDVPADDRPQGATTAGDETAGNETPVEGDETVVGEEQDAAAGEDEPGEQPAGEDEDAKPPDDDVEVELTDGSKVKLSEVEQGYMRQADYTQKTQEVARDREALTQLTQQYQQRVAEQNALQEKLLEYVGTLIPPEPDLSLAHTDPSTFQYQKALREQAIGEVQNLVALVNQSDQASAAAQTEQAEVLKQREEDALLREFPQLRDTEKRARFDKGFLDTAKSFGFTDQEIDSTFDHRVKKLVYFAHIGMNARKNQKNAQRRVVRKAAAGKGRAAVSPQRNAAAMNRLRKSGSIDDALGVDFDL